MGGRRSIWAGLPTERVHPSARELDRMETAAVLDLLAAEDARAVAAVYREGRRIARAAEAMAKTLAAGGRVLYLGAGTSGRLGVLEAAECPPTFGTPPGRIEAIVAGGRAAGFRAREGAEDRSAEARRAVAARRIGPADLLVGLSASSVTPFVRAGLAEARRRGARTILVTCGGRVRGVADLVVAPAVGPELLAGSTRLKAATATKLVLNAMTLLAMRRLGKLYGPYMVDLRPGSAKLRDRARRIVARVGRVDEGRASRLLRATGGEVKTAILVARRGLAVDEARRRLARHGGHLRAALEEDPGA